MTIAAGASFTTRQSRNSFSAVTIDMLQGKQSISVAHYDPNRDSFFSSTPEQSSFEIAPIGRATVRELAAALSEYRASLEWCAYYLAALLLDEKSEFPIPGSAGYAFGSFAVLQAQPDGAAKNGACTFKTFGNVLRVFQGRRTLKELLSQYGEVVEGYATTLAKIAASDNAAGSRLEELERDARLLAGAESVTGCSHILPMFDEIAASKDWFLLRVQAKRHVDSPNEATAAHARRMLAIGLSHSDDPADKTAAIDLFRTLVHDGIAQPSDFGFLATLLFAAESIDEAKKVVLDGIQLFATEASGELNEIGQRFVEAAGDREFRKQLDVAMAAGGRRD